MSDADCPDASSLLSLLAGRLPPGRHGELMRHVDACPGCQERIEHLDDTAETVRIGRLPTATVVAYEGEPECRRVLARLEEGWPRSVRDAGRTPRGFHREEGEAQAEETPRFVGHYELLQEIGRGGMGVVYRARDDRLNRVVAVKMIRRGMLPSPEELERFRAEAETAAGLDHPSIVPIYEVGGADGPPYFAMPLIEGRSLADLVSEGPLPPRVAAEHARAVARGVAYAHARGVIHRDLKPANLLLDPGGSPRITDFGLAKRTESDSDLTGTGQILGTPGYMSPEQAEGRASEVGPASDVYSLGATLYCLLTGRPPFQAASKVETIRQVVERDPVPPRQLNRAIPRDLETICLKCLEKSAGRRYRSAAELADDLGRFLDGRPILARPVGAAGASLRWVRRRPVVAVLAASLVLVATSGVTAVLWQWRVAHARAAAERWERYRADIVAAASAFQAHNQGTARGALEDAPAEHRGWEWRHFSAQLDHSLATLAGHHHPVNQVAFHPDGRRVASGSGDGSILVWDTTNRRQIASLRGHTKLITRLDFVASGTLLASSSGDGTLRLWDFERGSERAVLRGHSAPALWLRASPDGRRLVSGSADGTVRVWDAATGEGLSVFPGHEPGVGAAAFSPDGTRVATGSGDGKLRLWNLASGERGVIDTGQGPIVGLGFSPDGRRIATGHVHPNNVVCLFDVPSGRRVALASGHENTVMKVAFSPDGALLASASTDQTARLWDGATGRPVATLRGHAGQVYDVAFRPDGRRLVTTSRDQSLRLWDAATGDLISVFGGHRGVVWVAAWSPDGRLLASGADDGALKLWDAGLLERNGVLRGHESFVYDVAWTPDGDHVVSCAWDGTVRTWDASSQRETGRQSYPGAILSGLALSPDGRRLALVRGDNRLLVRDADGDGPAWELEQPTDLWRQRPKLVFSPSGNRVAAATAEGTVTLWDFARGETTRLATGDPGWQLAVAYSPDGRILATAGEDGVVRLWESASRRPVGELRGHAELVNALAFSPDGRLLASSSEDATVRLWDVASRLPSGVLPHDGIVYDVAFSPDGVRLASACADNTIRLWDVASRAGLVELRGHGAYVHAVAFSPDGTRLASASGDATIRIWDTLTPEARAHRPAPSVPSHASPRPR